MFTYSYVLDFARILIPTYDKLAGKNAILPRCNGSKWGRRNGQTRGWLGIFFAVPYFLSAPFFAPLNSLSPSPVNAALFPFLEGRAGTLSLFPHPTRLRRLFLPLLPLRLLPLLFLHTPVRDNSNGGGNGGGNTRKAS